MTQEEKDLLLKDLCARLPYGIKCKILENNEIKILGSVQYDGVNTLFDFWEDEHKIQYGYQLYLSEFKPYLFPMSSMTEEQEKELNKVYSDEADLIAEHLKSDISGNIHTHRFNHQLSLNWFLKNHFDINGLIPMGLAIDATNLNIY